MNESPEAPRVDAEPPAAVISGTAAGPVADLLFQLLIEVVRRHRPDIEPVLRGGANIAGLTPELMARALQAQGIWFQLLSLAEQNAAMRRRRQVERTRGRDALRGTFAHVLAEAAADGVPAKEIQSLLSGLRIRPVITAHPTESKRVTVLEKYRRIYLLLRELEIPRWTERERNALIDDLRDQIPARPLQLQLLAHFNRHIFRKLVLRDLDDHLLAHRPIGLCRGNRPHHRSPHLQTGHRSIKTRNYLPRTQRKLKWVTALARIEYRSVR